MIKNELIGGIKKEWHTVNSNMKSEPFYCVVIKKYGKVRSVTLSVKNWPDNFNTWINQLETA